MRHTGRTAATVDDDARRAALERQMEFVADNDAVASHAIYHDDAVLEFPQSGERFEGVDNFREWRAQYPTKVEFRVRRISGSGDMWVREMSVSYDGGAWMLGVAVLEFRGDRIARERIYVTEQWDAPEWRAPGAPPRPPSDHGVRARCLCPKHPARAPEPPNSAHHRSPRHGVLTPDWVAVSSAWCGHGRRRQPSCDRRSGRGLGRYRVLDRRPSRGYGV